MQCNGFEISFMIMQVYRTLVRSPHRHHHHPHTEVGITGSNSIPFHSIPSSILGKSMENGMVNIIPIFVQQNGKWSGMESGKEYFLLCGVEWKKRGMEMEWKVEWKTFTAAGWNGILIEWKWNGKWNGNIYVVVSGMEKNWNGNWNGNGMEQLEKMCLKWNGIRVEVEWNGNG